MTAVTSVVVRPLATRIGAVIEGVDLTSPPDERTTGLIREALLAHRVVFFRDQHLDAAQQQRFARSLGPLTHAHPTLPSAEGEPNVFDLDSATGAHADHWHTDVTFVDRPPVFSVLRADVIPPVGGDTVWANTVAAYADLKPELQSLAAALRAVHSNTYDYGRPAAAVSADRGNPSRSDYIRRFVSEQFETEHPVVRIHPETGERALLLGGFARRIVGYPSAASAALLRLFHEHVVRPENTVRWSWAAGDVAVWDNRSTQHYAIYDYGSARRIVQRVTTAGEVPVGVDGRPSVATRGESSRYLAV